MPSSSEKHKLSTTEVAKALGVTQRKVLEWKDVGAPHEKRGRRIFYDARDLSEWLVNTGRGDSTDENLVEHPAVLTTKRAIALRFSVLRRSITEWLADPSFPGVSHGRTGEYPVKEIAEWIIKNNKKAQVPDDIIDSLSDAQSMSGKSMSYRDKLTSIKADLAEIELQREQGLVVEAEQFAAFCQRIFSQSRTVLLNSPGRFEVALPSDFPEAGKKIGRKVMQETVEMVLMQLQELIDGDQDEE